VSSELTSMLCAAAVLQGCAPLREFYHAEVEFRYHGRFFINHGSGK